MKESYGEGLANHTSLESCGNYSNVMAEALTEGSTGGLLSSGITSFRVPTTWSDGEGNTFCRAIMRAAERPGGVLELGMCGHLLHGNRETLHLVFTYKDPHGEPQGDTAMMYECRELDSFILSEKPSNKVRDNKRMAEEVEKRGLAEGNLVEQNKGRTQSRRTFVKCA